MDVTLIIAVATMGGLAFIFAGGLAFADKKLHVEENPLIAKINDALPGANCGACSKAGCYDFATNVVEGKSVVTGCPVGGNDTAKILAEIMGVDANDTIKQYPRILCNGGISEAADKITKYYGPLNCSVLDIVSGGDKLCFYGCLGGGECVEACPFDALFMNENGLPELIEANCTGCAMCVKACPRDIIEMHPEDRNVFVFCKNHDNPKQSKNVCSVSCMGCSICARPSEGGIIMDNDLAVIDYELLNETIIPFEKCRTGALKKLHSENGNNIIN
jgi:H+/Na+-translocating ferredoxin:NAD+ oxidoreductase subunit B